MKTIQDYNEVKHLDYVQFINLRRQQGGSVDLPYFRTPDCNSKNLGSGDGRHRHHIYENLIPGLSNPEVAKVNDFKYQEADALVLLDPADHIFAHILIAEETVVAELGRNGAQTLLDHYRDSLDPALIKVFEERLSKTGTLLKHNIDLYNSVNYSMTTDGKTLCTLATGGGKSTVALQYMVDSNARTLVLAPKRTITEDWSDRRKRYPQVKEVMCYSSFQKIDIQQFLDKQEYDLIVLDEVHHLAKNGAWAKNVIEVMKDPRYKVLGITAENKRSDNTRVADILFAGKVCKGMTTAEMLKSGIFWPISYISTLLGVPQINLDPQCAFLQRDLDLALNIDRASNIIKKYKPNYKKVKGIVFIPRGDGSGDNFAQAKEILIETYGPNVPIWEINYKLGAKKCKDIKDEFEKADHGFIIAIDMISEGVHFKGINCVIILRNAQSPLVVNQQVGRLTRIKHDYEQDPECILFDLVNIIKTVDYRDLVNRVSKTDTGQAIKELSQKSGAVIYDDQCERLYEVLERSHTFTQVNLFEDVCVL